MSPRYSSRTGLDCALRIFLVATMNLTSLHVLFIDYLHLCLLYFVLVLCF